MDTGTTLYCWVGKGATQTEKTQSLQRAQRKFTFYLFFFLSIASKIINHFRLTFPLFLIPTPEFIQTKKYPTWTPVHRVVEGTESAPFKQYFATWRDVGMSHTRLIRAANDNDADGSFDDGDDDFDPAVLHALKKSGGRALGFMPDNGEGDVEVWRIKDKDVVQVDPEVLGVFFGDSSYVVKYHYANKRGGEGDVIYYWQVSCIRFLLRPMIVD